MRTSNIEHRTLNIEGRNRQDVTRQRLWRWVLLVLCAAVTTYAGEPIELTRDPAVLHGLPGEPLLVELTTDTAKAWPMHLQVPAVSNLVLHTVERIPIQRTPEGRFVQKRIILWQGVEAGTSSLTNLRAEVNGTIHHFPPLEITISAVEPAAPPSPPSPPPVEAAE